MDKNMKAGDAGRGRLPASAPLANPYVPFQTAEPPKYEAEHGLIRGTLYPGLDLPLMGNSNQIPLPVTPKTQLQAIAFAIQELALYLDTHPEDTEALMLYRKYQQMYQRCSSAYNKEHGPMTHMMPAEQDDYSWINDPWPWEFGANKEA